MHLSNAWKSAAQIPKGSIWAGQEWKPSATMFTAFILVLTSHMFLSSVWRFTTTLLPIPTHWNWQLEISDWEFQSNRISLSDLKQNLQSVRIWIMGLTHRMTTQTTPPSPIPLTPGQCLLLKHLVWGILRPLLPLQWLIDHWVLTQIGLITAK